MQATEKVFLFESHYARNFFRNFSFHEMQFTQNFRDYGIHLEEVAAAVSSNDKVEIKRSISKLNFVIL